MRPMTIKSILCSLLTLVYFYPKIGPGNKEGLEKEILFDAVQFKNAWPGPDCQKLRLNVQVPGLLANACQFNMYPNMSLKVRLVLRFNSMIQLNTNWYTHENTHTYTYTLFTIGHGHSVGHFTLVSFTYHFIPLQNTVSNCRFEMKIYIGSLKNIFK